MTTPMPTEENFQHGATYAADGVTQLTASSAASLVSVPTEHYVVSTNIFESRVPDGTGYPALEMVQLFEAGEVIQVSQWTAAFPLPTVTALTPATCAHASTVVVTMTGENFTPGTTVHVNGNPATGVTITAPDEMTFTTPTNSGAATVDVTVTNDGGTLTLTNAFIYT